MTSIFDALVQVRNLMFTHPASSLHRLPLIPM